MATSGSRRWPAPDECSLTDPIVRSEPGPTSAPRGQRSWAVSLVCATPMSSGRRRSLPRSNKVSCPTRDTTRTSIARRRDLHGRTADSARHFVSPGFGELEAPGAPHSSVRRGAAGRESGAAGPRRRPLRRQRSTDAAKSSGTASIMTRSVGRPRLITAPRRTPTRRKPANAEALYHLEPPATRSDDHTAQLQEQS